MRAGRAVCSDDMPAEYVRLVLGLPDGWPVDSRVDAIRETYDGAAGSGDQPDPRAAARQQEDEGHGAG